MTVRHAGTVEDAYGSGRMAVLGRSERIAIIAILTAHCLLAVLYGLVVPLGEAPDEVDHYAYVRYLLTERRLPEGPTVTQGKHPPLYYILAATAAAWAEPGFEFVRANPDFSLTAQDSSPNLLIHTSLEGFPFRDGPLVMHLARVLSAFLSTIGVWATYRTARLAVPTQHSFAIGVAGVVAFVPGVVFVNGSVNNDNLAAPLAALALLGSARVVREGISVRRGITLGTLLGLALLAKVGTLAVWPAAALALAAAIARSPRHGCASPGGGETTAFWKRLVMLWLGWSGLSFGLALAVASPWLARNWRLYGDPLGWALVRSTVDLREVPLGWRDLTGLLRGWFTTFWGRFGGAVHIYLPTPLYGVLGAITLLSALGLVLGLLRLREEARRARWRERQSTAVILAMLSLTLVATALSVVRYSLIGLGTDQARLLFPALSPIGVLFFLGLAQWMPIRRWKALAGGLAVGGLVFGVVALFFLRSIYAPPAPADEGIVRRIGRDSTVAFGERLTLVGHDLKEPAATAGEMLRFTLYWRAEVVIEEDLRAEVWVEAPDGGLVASWKRSPLGGRFSTDRWPVGAVYADTYSLLLPGWLSPGVYTLEVGVREFPSESWLQPSSGEDAPQHPFAQIRVRD